MATPPAAGATQPQVVSIPVSGTAGIGDLTITPPTFLEKWGVVFVSVAGGWVLAVCAGLIWYYMHHLSPPSATGATAADYKASLDLYKTASDELRDSLGSVFDMVVTKTILPLVTLLLGYLFGSKKT
jgi:hypothetical protein